MDWVKEDLTADERHVAVLIGALFRDLGTRLPSPERGGLRQSQLRVLSAVPPHGVTVTELAQRVQMTAQGSGQFVATLAESGHLQVRREPADRRRRIVLRTPLGDTAVLAAAEAVRDIERGWAARVGPDRYAVFRAVLDELTLGPSG